MLALPNTVTRNSIPPGFIDFASSSFDAILFPNSSQINTDNVNDGIIKKRNTHLPDLIPFIQLITDKCDVQPVHLVLALMYVQRFRKALPAGYKAEPEAAHRIFVASLLVASKYCEDRCLSTKHVVHATGDVWSIKEITRMELAFLRFLHWDLYVSQEEMTKFLCDLGFDIRSILSTTSEDN
ncbi:cyclin-like protein [Cokeromyces recurvatus]|uniref:cyclin-like protein n=1 Tax=Cokeromyces recurvatus TaxID=90255 RepID=UPI00221FF4BE|nr:cyclin-like protein [Cokeromyces recurvatus]KAI7900950.1 cyclin-like protein [Cokeromyces recurvatus]